MLFNSKHEYTELNVASVYDFHDFLPLFVKSVFIIGNLSLYTAAQIVLHLVDLTTLELSSFLIYIGIFHVNSPVFYSFAVISGYCYHYFLNVLRFGIN